MASDRVVYVDTSSFDELRMTLSAIEGSKNEDTWYTMLWHLRCRIRFNPESTQGVVVRMAWYIFVQNRNGNWNVPYLIENDDQVILNWNWLDNDWNDNYLALRFATLFFLPSLVRGVLFFQELSAPPTEHSPNFIQLY